MAKSHEVVIIGGGHNGLTVAGYLAKAGVDVCVVEALSTVGGGVITIEPVALVLKWILARCGMVSSRPTR